MYVRGTHTDTQDAGNGGVHLQLQDEREGKRQEYRREHELRMRAQKANKSGHEYQCKRTIEYTTTSTILLLVSWSEDQKRAVTLGPQAVLDGRALLRPTPTFGHLLCQISCDLVPGASRNG